MTARILLAERKDFHSAASSELTGDDFPFSSVFSCWSRKQLW